MFLYQRSDFVYVSDVPQFVLYKWTFSTRSNVQIPPEIVLFSLDSSISQAYLHFRRENTVMSIETNQIAKHAADIMRHSNLFQLCDIVSYHNVSCSILNFASKNNTGVQSARIQCKTYDLGQNRCVNVTGPD